MRYLIVFSAGVAAGLFASNPGRSWEFVTGLVARVRAWNAERLARRHADTIAKQ